MTSSKLQNMKMKIEMINERKNDDTLNKKNRQVKSLCNLINLFLN